MIKLARPSTFTATRSPMVGVDILDIKVAEVDFNHIATCLAAIPRFLGAAGHYSVAQHCVRLAETMKPEIQLYGLLHDAHEAYIGDLTRPFRAALDITLANLSSRKKLGELALALITEHIDEAIYLAAGLQWPVPDLINAEIKYRDNNACEYELNTLFAENAPPAFELWSAAQSRDQFLKLFNSHRSQ